MCGNSVVRIFGSCPFIPRSPEKTKKAPSSLSVLTATSFISKFGSIHVDHASSHWTALSHRPVFPRNHRVRVVMESIFHEKVRT